MSHSDAQRSPEGMRAIGAAGTQACLPVRPAGILPAAKVSRRAALSDATDAIGDIMSAFRSQRVSNPLGAQAAGLCSLSPCAEVDAAGFCCDRSRS